MKLISYTNIVAYANRLIVEHWVAKHWYWLRFSLFIYSFIFFSLQITSYIQIYLTAIYLRLGKKWIHAFPKGLFRCSTPNIKFRVVFLPV